VQRETLADLVGPRGEDPWAAQIVRMRDRLRQCAAVSAFVLDLRCRMLEAGYGGG
jgi:hypothetical protein